MKETKENDDKYIHINSDKYKIIYCLQCNFYLIYLRGVKENNRCENCNSPSLQNVFIDEAKIYFDAETCDDRKTTLVKGNPSFVKRRNYSWKIIQNMDNP